MNLKLREVEIVLFLLWRGNQKEPEEELQQLEELL